MELTYVTIIVLASMIFVLAGMVGYLYWQQTRMLQHMQSLSTFIASQLTQPPEEHEHEHEVVEAPQPLPEAEDKSEPKVELDSDSEDDDRLSVEEKVEVVEGPPPPKEEVDIDDLQSKTATQLKELLTQKGIPFGKRDSKPVLLQLLKAIA
jgi:hypothetical protein